MIDWDLWWGKAVEVKGLLFQSNFNLGRSCELKFWMIDWLKKKKRKRKEPLKNLMTVNRMDETEWNRFWLGLAWALTHFTHPFNPQNLKTFTSHHSLSSLDKSDTYCISQRTDFKKTWFKPTAKSHSTSILLYFFTSKQLFTVPSFDFYSLSTLPTARSIAGLTTDRTSNPEWLLSTRFMRILLYLHSVACTNSFIKNLVYVSTKLNKHLPMRPQREIHCM